MNNRYQKILDEIKLWTLDNGSQISYALLLDFFRNEKQIFSDNEFPIDQIICELALDGIEVLPMEEGESYPAEKSDSETLIPAHVNISQTPMAVSDLMERLSNQMIDLSSALHRKDIWDDILQSRLIESLMLRIPIPAFYFDASQGGKWRVISGLQCLTTFRDYLVGYTCENLTVESMKPKKTLKGLQYYSDYNGKTFDELPRQYVRRIKETQIIAYCVEKGTPESVVYNIYQRINTSGSRQILWNEE